jgi:carbonic anhydrase/acetyltransferase-like protein (isoleucine patch superfamily)
LKNNQEYRLLSAPEIEILKQQGVSAINWDQILVSQVFIPQNIRNVQFSGSIKIGDNSGTLEFSGGIVRNCGLYNATIHNCTIGNQVYISQVSNYLANYDIHDHVIVENIELCYVDQESAFGNGIKVSTLDETGGRGVMIYDKLSAHLAYFLAWYKHRHCLIQELESKITEYANSVKSNRGTIGKYSVIRNCRQIKNMKFGSYSQITGCTRLENGSVNSNEFAPVKLGAGILAENFIVSSGSEISDGTIVSNCFIGQGCVLGKQYSAENSLFFANCQGFHGEACSIFGGPYTVTHHKSTLLIAGMFSFCNAGSGSNQSNHMYKLGPIHHGIVERGSKTTSDSYILWPAKIGAFTLVMGRHYKNTDTSDLPFSYLIENKDDSWIAPGVNLRSVGTIRDVMKWPRRDRRKDPEKLDCINFNLLSPFTIKKMQKGLGILNSLKEISGETTEVFAYRNTLISKSALEKGINLYDKAIYKFLGNSVISRLEKCNVQTMEELTDCLKPKHSIGEGEWSDLAGLIAPKTEISKLIKSIERCELSSLKDIEQEFKTMHDHYYEFEWIWASELLVEKTGKKIDDLTMEDIISLIKKWKESVIGLDQLLYEDAKKEFRMDSMTGFGMDGNKTTQKLDFEKVRGNFESNDFVNEIVSHIDRKTLLGDKMLEKLATIEKTYHN